MIISQGWAFKITVRVLQKIKALFYFRGALLKIKGLFKSHGFFKDYDFEIRAPLFKIVIRLFDNHGGSFRSHF